MKHEQEMSRNSPFDMDPAEMQELGYRVVDAIVHALGSAHKQAVVESRDVWEVVTPASLGVLTFRYRAVEGSDVAVDRFNASIAERISRSGFAYITTTELGNRLVLRMCPIHPGATRDDVDETFVRLEQAAHLTAQIE